MEEKKTEKGTRKKIKFMSRNVTEFRHLMANSLATQNDLEWVINLRDNNPTSTKGPRESAPPQVFFKKTQTFQMKNDKNAKQQQEKIIPNQFDQIFLKNQEHSHHTKQQLTFYNSLRKNKINGKMPTSVSQQQFTNIPFKDRKQIPKFIRKEFVKKVRPLTNIQFESGLDGAHKQGPYTQNILRTKNYGFLQSFTKMRGRSQVCLPSLAWQIGLRNYR